MKKFLGKKGFTLVELLAVVVILVVIMVIALPNFGSSIDRNEKKQDKKVERALQSSGELYIKDNIDDISVEVNESDNKSYCYFEVKDLIENNYISSDDIADYTNGCLIFNKTDNDYYVSKKFSEGVCKVGDISSSEKCIKYFDEEGETSSIRLNVEVRDGTKFSKSKNAIVTVSDKSGTGFKKENIDIYYSWGIGEQKCSDIPETSKIQLLPSKDGVKEVKGTITINDITGKGEIYVCNKSVIKNINGGSLVDGTSDSAKMYLDNTLPVISEVNKSDDGKKIYAKLSDEHSKITSYAVTNSNDEDSIDNWNNVDSVSEYNLEFDVNGFETYYIWAKDGAGNVSNSSISIVGGIEKPSISLCENKIYNGEVQQLTSVTGGEGYTLSGYTGTDAGIYTITATLLEGYQWNDETSDSVTFDCSIGKKKLDVSKFTYNPLNKIYDGSVDISNDFGVVATTDSGLLSGDAVSVNYTEAVYDNMSAGTDKIITVSGMSLSGDKANNYELSYTTYDVGASIDSKSLSDVAITPTSYTYDGTKKKPTVTVKDGNKELVNGTDYAVTYSNNTSVGTGKVTVTGKGNYTGTVIKTFTISYKTYVITLNNQSATSAGTKELYGRYVDGVYLDSTYSKKMVESSNKITIPSKTNYYFLGYYDSNDVQMISESGYITSKLTSTTYNSDQTLYAKWLKKVYQILDGAGEHVTYAGSLKEAVSLVNDGETIKTLFDNESEAVVVDKDITLNTNGKTISMTGTITINSTVLIDGGGMIALLGGENDFEDDSSVVLVSSEGNLKFSSGTIQSIREGSINSVIVDGGFFELNGGTIHSFDDGIVSNNGTVIISSGLISTNYDSIENTNGTVTITGGFIHSSHRTILNKGESSKLVIGTNDGIVDNEGIELVTLGELDDNDNYNEGPVVESDTVWYFYDGVLESMIPITNLDNVVVEENYSIVLENYYDDNNYLVYKYYLDHNYRVLDSDGEVVGGTDTLAKAVSLADDGDTIVVLRDNRTAGTKINKNLTLDTNGKIITLTQNIELTSDELIVEGTGEIILLPAVLFDVKSGATLSVAGGTIGFNGVNAGPVIRLKGGTFNLYDGTLESINSIINAYSGVINITGGTLDAGSYGIVHMQSVSISDNLTINITGGTISADINEWAAPIFIQEGSEIVNINITGGIITGTGYGIINRGTKTNCVITGGTITSVAQSAIQTFDGTLIIGKNDSSVNTNSLSITSSNSYAINSSMVWEFYDGVLYSIKNPTYTGTGPSTLSEYSVETIEEDSKYKTYLSAVSTNGDNINGLRSTNSSNGCDIFYITTCTSGVTGKCSYTIKNLFSSVGVLTRGDLSNELTNCKKISIEDTYLFVEAGLTSSSASASQIIGILNKDSTVYITTEDVVANTANRKIMIPYESDSQMLNMIGGFTDSGNAYANGLTKFVTFNDKKYLYAWVNRSSFGIS